MLSSLVFSNVDANRFFNPIAISNVILSPNGEQIASIQYINSQQVVTLKQASDNKSTTVFSPSNKMKDKYNIRKLAWLDNRYISAQLDEKKKGNNELITTQHSQRIIIIDTSKNINDENSILSVRTKGWLVHTLPNTPNTFLYAKAGNHSKVYSIKIDQLSTDKKKLGKLDRIDGGQFIPSNAIKSTKGYALRWFFNDSGEAKALFYVNKEKKLELIEFTETGSSNIIKTWGTIRGNSNHSYKDSSLYPFILAENTHTFYSLKSNDNGTRSIYKIDYTSGNKELIYETNYYDIVDIDLNEKREIIGVVILKNGHYQHEFISKTNKNTPSVTVFTELSPTVSYSLDKSKSIVYRESHNKQGEYFFYDTKNETYTPIGKTQPELASQFTSVQWENTIDVEGLRIPYILNLPNDDANKKYPLVVMPHGGPISVHDTQYYDETTQFLTSNGLAVLRVNFRGSGGYSKAFEEAGKLQFGKLILKDIHASTIDVLKHKNIDENKVCIFGASYGGYASTRLLLDYPEVYICGINLSGVSDIPLSINNARHAKETKEWLREYIGDPEKDYEALKSQSPLYQIGTLSRPYFMIHGAKDTVVSVEHTYRLQKMLEKHNKPFELYIDPESGHHFLDTQRRIRIFNKIIDFLLKNLTSQK